MNVRTTPKLPAIIAIGFGVAVVMWIVGFVTHLPSLRLGPEWLIALFVIVQAAGGIIAARNLDRQSAIVVAAGAGLLTACINLLIVGSIVAEAERTNTLRPGWPLIIGGSFVFNGVVAGLAAALAPVGEVRGPPPDTRRWLSRFARITAASALPVLLSGGLVTSAGAGLAVPDWPTSYSANMFLYPLSKMTGGIYYEHAHRLFGSLVGLTTLTLFISILIAEPRWWVKAFGLKAFLFVCGQGILGGIRVTTADSAADGVLADNKDSLVLAMVHGITGQLFFATLCALAATLSVRWIAADRSSLKPDRGLRTLSMLLFPALVLQLGLGAAARHLAHPHALWTHVGFALIVLVLAALTAFRAMSRKDSADPLRTLGHGVLHSVSLQVVLGGITLMLVMPLEQGRIDPPHTVVLATAHQAVGAILIGLSAAMLTWSLMINAPAAQPPNSRSTTP